MLESLAAAGAFDALESNRARVFAAGRHHAGGGAARATRPGERALRSSRLAISSSRGALPAAEVEAWLPAERLQKEFDAIGFFLSGHPLDDYMPALKRMRVQSWVEFYRAVKSG